MNLTANKNALIALGEQCKASFAGEQVEKCFPANDTMEKENKQQEKSIADYLLKGERNAIPAQALAEALGCGSVRELRKLVHAERKAGRVILSSRAGGYFIPDEGAEGKQEIERFIRSLTNQAKNTLDIIKSAKTALNKTEGQIGIDL